MAEVQELTTPVVIVGGGPVGLVLALFLDFYGVKSTIINTEPNERWHPKGNGQNARTMEHYRRLGFADEVRAALKAHYFANAPKGVVQKNPPDFSAFKVAGCAKSAKGGFECDIVNPAGVASLERGVSGTHPAGCEIRGETPRVGSAPGIVAGLRGPSTNQRNETTRGARP